MPATSGISVRMCGGTRSVERDGEREREREREERERGERGESER